ncbi:MAG: alpha/beta hydrolase [Bacteroidales bacterium]|nr:alpha/beta hydrolase [Bacteroidales bacterium]
MEIKLRPAGTAELYGIYLPVKKAVACIILVHGLGEHIGRYKDMAAFFNENKYSFIGPDLPGHGKSPGKRGHIRDFSLYNNIIDEVASYVREHEGDIPLVLYGNSLGGSIALNYLVTGKNIHSGIITSPWLKLSFEPPGIKVLLARVFSGLIPSLLQDSGLDPDDLSQDKNVVKNYRSDPLVHSLISLGLYVAASRNASALLECRDKLQVPVLIMHGGCDRILSAEGSETFAGNNRMAELKIWADGFHELHNEVFREEVYVYILKWLNKRYEIQNRN